MKLDLAFNENLLEKLKSKCKVLKTNKSQKSFWMILVIVRLKGYLVLHRSYLTLACFIVSGPIILTVSGTKPMAKNNSGLFHFF